MPLVVKTPDEVEKMVIEDLARDYSDEQLDADGKAGAMLALYPMGIDLKAATVKLLKSQIAGFYDPHGKQMVLVEGADNLGFWNRGLEFVIQRDLVGEMLLAHELTHALQDQNFALQDKLDNLKLNGDAELALKCVAEGDATLAGFAYIAGRMDNSVADTLSEHMKDLPQAFAAQAKDTPPGLSIPLIFQYSQGVSFVAQAYRRGGWSAVDALYAKPPQSTQQIIDPALYFEEPTPPVAVSVEGYQSLLSNWKKIDEDTEGELTLQIILQMGFGRIGSGRIGDGKDAPEVRLADKWAGDRIVILKAGFDLSVIWLLAMRDRDSAAKFAVGYRALLDRERASTPHAIEQRSNAVLVIAGPAANQFATLAPAIWKASKIGPVQPYLGLRHAARTENASPAAAPGRRV